MPSPPELAGGEGPCEVSSGTFLSWVPFLMLASKLPRSSLTVGRFGLGLSLEGGGGGGPPPTPALIEGGAGAAGPPI